MALLSRFFRSVAYEGIYTSRPGATLYVRLIGSRSTAIVRRWPFETTRRQQAYCKFLLFISWKDRIGTFFCSRNDLGALVSFRLTLFALHRGITVAEVQRYTA